MANRVLQCLLAVVSAMAPAIITIHIMQKVPSPPGALDMQNSHVLTTRVELRWDASPGYVDNYLVMLKNCAGDVVAKKSTESTQPSVFIDNPHTGTTYEVVIWAVAGGKFSDPVTATIRVKESQLKFRDLLVKEIRTTSVMLEWTRSAYNLVQNYKVKWYPVNSKSIQIKNVAPDETSMYIEDLTPGQLFKFIVTSYIPSQCGDEERVQSEDISVRTPPASPGELDMQNSHVLTTRVELRWEASPGYVDNYVVVLKNCAGDVVAEKRTKSTQPSVSFDNPHTGTTYEVVIWAVADGKLSDHVTATIRVKESQLKFRDLLAKEIRTTSVMLEWTRPAYNLVQNYKVKWYPVNSKSVQIKNVAPDETSMYIEDLTPGQLFKFIVTSYIPSQCGDEERVQSEDISLRTLEEGLPQPPFIDEKGSSAKSTTINLKFIKTLQNIMKQIIIRKTNDNSEVVRLESRKDSVLVDEGLEINTLYEIEIYVKTRGKISGSQFLNMRTKDVKVSMPCLIGGILGGTIAIASFGPLLCLLGFGGGGIIGGSIAAWLMKLGTIKAGSLFAILQSVGVIGLGVAGKAKLIAAGIAVGCMVEELI